MNAIVPAGKRPPPQPDSVRLVRAWLMKLGNLTVTTAENRLTPDRATVMAEYLLQYLPVAAFDDRSMQAILPGMGWFPPVDVLRTKLADFWAMARPAPQSRLPLLHADDNFAARLEERQNPTLELERRRAERAARMAEWAAADPDSIRASVAELRDNPMAPALGRILGSAVAANAPQHLDLVPPAWHPPEAR
jgi:hypothetical protein